MAKKIYISVSNQTSNPCKMGDSEAKHCYAYAETLAGLLRTSGFDVKLCTYCQGIKEMVSESNDWGADLHLVNHTNAANGSVRGSNIFISGKWEETRKLAGTLKKHREQVYKAGVTIRTNNSWYEMVNVKAYCVYEELVFHDNCADAAWFHDNYGELAEATARALCEHYGYTYGGKSETPVQGGADTYTVQSGDTLTYIARKYGLTYQEIADYNGIKDPNRIYTGQVIKIPGKAAAAVSIKAGDTVRVKPGSKTYDGKTKLADFVYRQDYTVLELKGDRAVIGKGKVVTAAVKLGDLTRA